MMGDIATDNTDLENMEFYDTKGDCTTYTLRVRGDIWEVKINYLWLLL